MKEAIVFPFQDDHQKDNIFQLGIQYMNAIIALHYVGLDTLSYICQFTTCSFRAVDRAQSTNLYSPKRCLSNCDAERLVQLESFNLDRTHRYADIQQ